MASISPEFVERYQIELEKNPGSRVFAPLAEAYRQMGLLEEAFRVCAKGVQQHPEFASGRVAFAKILIDRKEWEKALAQLEKAAQISPDNLLAHSLLGDTLLELRRPKEALQAFKMVLFLNPNDDKALKAVRKWEFLSADEYDDEMFKMKPVFEAGAPAPVLTPLEDHALGDGSGEPPMPVWRAKELERALSLADAFTVRGDLEKAIHVLRDASEELGALPDLERRLALLSRQAEKAGINVNFEPRSPQRREIEMELRSPSFEPARAPADQAVIDRRREKLQKLLRRIHLRRDQTEL